MHGIIVNVFRIRFGLTTGVLLVSILLCLPAAAQETTPPAANTVCPVMVGKAINKEYYVDHKDKRVYFCCPYCVKLFKEAPEKYEPKIPAFSPQSLTPHAALASDTREHLPPFLQFLGKLHPVVVHFPIALLLAALLAELLARLVKPWNAVCLAAARFMLPLGALGSIPAVIFGWLAADGAGKTGELALLLYRHRWLGIITMSLAIVATVVQLFAYRYKKPGLTWMYLALLLLAGVLAGVTGHLGGLLVYGMDRFS